MVGRGCPYVSNSENLYLGVILAKTGVSSHLCHNGFTIPYFEVKEGLTFIPIKWIRSVVCIFPFLMLWFAALHTFFVLE